MLRSTRSTRRIIFDRFRLEADAEAIGSPLGAQLERMRNGLQSATPSQPMAPAAERRLLHLAELCGYMRDLTPAELEACRLRYWAVEAYADVQRSVPDTELRKVEPDDELPAQVTRDGDEVIGPAPVEGRSIVSGKRALLTSFQTIARVMGISSSKVRRLIDRAHSKVAKRLEG